MNTVVDLMIFAGSALMVYNIMQYGGFVYNSLTLESGSKKKGLVLVPLVLMIFFLIGYLGVAIMQIANLLIAAILFFGSVFITVMLKVMFSIIAHVRETDEILSTRYDEMKEELGALTKNSLAVFRVNLTKDEIEERGGTGLYESDYATDKFSELMDARRQYVVDADYAGMRESIFTRDGLLQHYLNGQTSASEVVLVRKSDGEVAFVSLEATLTKMPVSGDVVAFVVERLHNEQVVRDTLLESVLMDRYDRIAYLIDGKYYDVISNAGKKECLLLPDNAGDTYESVYLNHILPTMQKNENDPAGQPNPLRLSVIDKALAKQEKYEVSAPFVIGGETRYKQISFYRIDAKAKFYLMLITDSTETQEGQKRQSKTLSEAQAEAERSNRARIRFFTNLSHDFRTPMNGILGFTNMAKTENDPAKLRSYLDKVEFSGHKLMALMDDLFAMSLIDSDALELESAPVDLREMVEDLKNDPAAEDPSKGIRLETDLSGLRKPVVLCDRQRMMQLLERLLQNAGFFAPENASVYLSVAQPEERDDLCEFVIRNRGCTIPQETIERILSSEPHDQTDLPEMLPGAGLGMAVTREFIRRMDGSVGIKVLPEDTTEIRIRLTLQPDETPEPVQEAPVQPGVQRRLLVVDDNAVNPEIAELMLTAEGYEIDKACDGAEAVEKVSSSAPGTYDLVLMDVQMPVLNGYEATAEIRALPDPKLAKIPIIALTANAYQEDAEDALKAGMNGYATKPFDPEKLRDTIEKLLREQENA